MLIEKNYDMSKEQTNASLFTTSNGYIGIRGSMEENATIGVQGGFVRGLIDEIPFKQDLNIDSDYMRHYYVNEDAAKGVRVQEGIINFADILFFTVEIDGEKFYPWTGKIHSWERYLDIEEAILKRRVVWENSKGDITEIYYERFASFSNDHFYVMKIDIKPVNHNKIITIESGIDFRTKSNGFHMTEHKTICNEENCIQTVVSTTGRYKHKYNISVVHNFLSDNGRTDENFITKTYSYLSRLGEKCSFEKKICITTSRDVDEYSVETGKTELLSKKYDILLEEHKKVWKDFFEKLDIRIRGDERADEALRFCNYHTACSIPRNDCVHSLSAKNLTGEGYNDYVWWDCEIFQSPIFIYAGIDAVKNMLLYRYNRLEAAKKYAKDNGYKGARFPFISSVTGEEKVWKHVKHPFLQIHVTAGVMFNIINYYTIFDDEEFMINYGIEMLNECANFWISRVEWVNDRYEIRGVACCDEHHPFVDNDAYTNYIVKYCLENTALLCKKFNVAYDNKIEEVAQNLYLPMDNTGYIPQFDGYFNLSRTLSTQGGGGVGFQMKNPGGQYHLSQIIKQPDVMMLFSYIPCKFKKEIYQKNWDYYEQMCEASSSLTFPVHAICSFDNNQLYKGYNYFMKSALIDVEDIHNCAKDGVHAGCIAGAWYSIVRGLLGVLMDSDAINISPKMIPWWQSVEVNLCWKGNPFTVIADENGFTVKAQGEIKIKYDNRLYLIKENETKRIEYVRK